MNNKLIVSSVVRGAQQGDSHGGLYVADLQSNKVQQVLDWKNKDISWEGRGGDRGLRGIAVGGDRVYVAASDELLVFTPKFERLGSFRNRYLKRCHEIFLHRGLLFLTSTGFDSVLVFDTKSQKFMAGLNLRRGPSGFRAMTFDPNLEGGPHPATTLHLNSVYVDDEGVYLAGRNLNALVRVRDNQVTSVARLPLNTHNARPFARGLLFNDTAEDQVCWVGDNDVVAFDLPRFEVKKLTHTDFDDAALARQAFGRGLCLLSDSIVAGGSSPSTISLYDLDRRERVKSINLTMDVRNAVHGLAVWPF
ncbi:MAG TPA: hypothetical protein VEF55_07410 [Candidatus Binatia bacterium]|nr:hypothetical protein [Candidatus Binatia bacterium]